MKRTKTKRTLLLAAALLLCALAGKALAEGRQRLAFGGDDEGAPSDTIQPYDTIAINSTMTASLRHSRENVIEDTAHVLRPFFLKLARRQEPVRVVHVGDSHVRGHIFPLVVRHLLEEDFGSEAVEDDKITYQTSGFATETGKPGLVYHILGINGAEASTFNNEEKAREIAALKPDLLIVSLGTNEAHARDYRAEDHREQLTALLKLLRDSCPDAAILLTTPPGAYPKGRRPPTGNPNTPTVCSVIRDCAARQGAAVWDLYEIAGGRTDACRNWTRLSMLKPDGVHFTPDGYTLQAHLLRDALVKAYNSYARAGLE